MKSKKHPLELLIHVAETFLVLLIVLPIAEYIFQGVNKYFSYTIGSLIIGLAFGVSYYSYHRRKTIVAEVPPEEFPGYSADKKKMALKLFIGTTVVTFFVLLTYPIWIFMFLAI